MRLAIVAFFKASQPCYSLCVIYTVSLWPLRLCSHRRSVVVRRWIHARTKRKLERSRGLAFSPEIFSADVWFMQYLWLGFSIFHVVEVYCASRQAFETRASAADDPRLSLKFLVNSTRINFASSGVIRYRNSAIEYYFPRENFTFTRL